MLELQLPLLPTLERYRRVIRGYGNVSVLRALQYEFVFGESLNGKLLDFGGGGNAQYRALLGDIDYQSINIDEKIDPTWVLKTGDIFPVEDATFDTVLTLNTLEHIYDSDFVLSEIVRVLKPGGQLVLTVPFLLRVHGHPDDFHRGTSSWWNQKLIEHGFENGQCTALIWGPFSNGSAVSGLPGPFKHLRRQSSTLLDLLYVSLRFRDGGSRFSGPVGRQLACSALGWGIRATKPVSG